jgi:hypothetical protein
MEHIKFKLSNLTYASRFMFVAVPWTDIRSITGKIHISCFNEIFLRQTGKDGPGNELKHAVMFCRPTDQLLYVTQK